MIDVAKIERRLEAIEEKLDALIEMLTGAEVDDESGLPYVEVRASCFEIKGGERTGNRIAWVEQVDGFDPLAHASLRDSLRDSMTEAQLADYCKRRLLELTGL